MDSEHRHELRENELAKFLKNLPDYIREHWAAIVGWACIIAAILLWSPIREWRASKQYQQMSEVTDVIKRVEQEKGTAAMAEDGEAAIMSVGELEELGRSTDNAKLGALALCKSAEALRADVHYGDLSREEVLEETARAKKLYEDALKRAKDDPVMTGMAKFGIGLCAEEVGNYEEAEQVYNEIVSNEEFAATVYPRQAEMRLMFMQDYKTEFTFEEVVEEEAAEEDGAAVEGAEQGSVFEEAASEGEALEQVEVDPSVETEGVEAESK
ncbi:hypothetical protein STSP2_00316 [Anaerohalosphaera lusitana]|uniref:Tetratricopeptide repeat-like domain-containing protein n=1 Tax=Anaerohalosphaera lusitana TaxID=1936003 RepID=A0A1U9NGW3_9BACT|nr:tetratricopeptide repeat protein [Anaerohalosphaera lusitana]AQT67173.1 hypothetical protein STSP2_00316 [Anaerohalosphaera lusitana]